MRLAVVLLGVLLVGCSSVQLTVQNQSPRGVVKPHLDVGRVTSSSQNGDPTVEVPVSLVPGQ